MAMGFITNNPRFGCDGFMLFAVTRYNLIRQLSDGNGIFLRLTDIVNISSSFSPKAVGNRSKMKGYQPVKIFEKKFLVEYFSLTII
jgi:hypothetical protein